MLNFNFAHYITHTVELMLPFYNLLKDYLCKINSEIKMAFGLELSQYWKRAQGEKGPFTFSTTDVTYGTLDILFTMSEVQWKLKLICLKARNSPELHSCFKISDFLIVDFPLGLEHNVWSNKHFQYLLIDS